MNAIGWGIEWKNVLVQKDGHPARSWIYVEARVLKPGDMIGLNRDEKLNFHMIVSVEQDGIKHGSVVLDARIKLTFLNPSMGLTILYQAPFHNVKRLQTNSNI